MSQMFDNYQKSDDYNLNPSGQVPDNTRQRLMICPGYDEVLILGSDNIHDFKIPHRFEEVSDLKIVYNQGIETKIIKEYHVVYNENNEIISETGDIHWDDGGNYSQWYSLISCTISDEETNKFNGYNKDINVQIFTTLRSGYYEPGYESGYADLTPEELMLIYKGKVLYNDDGSLLYQDRFIPTFGPCSFDASPIYKIKLVRKLVEDVATEENVDNSSETSIGLGASL